METPEDPKLDAMAASFLTADIDAARLEMAILDEKIATFQAQRRALAWKINALTPATQKTPAAVGASLTHNPMPTTNGTQVVDSANNGTANVGFRDRIRLILRESSRGLKPIEITKKLQESGLEYHAKTDLNVRVCNDLNKLFRSGNVKRRSGLYSLPTESAAHVNSQ